MSYEDARKAARAKLDDAIREYSRAIWEGDTDREDSEYLGVGGWVLACHSPSMQESQDGYAVETAEGQAPHSSGALYRYGMRWYDAVMDGDDSDD